MMAKFSIDSVALDGIVVLIPHIATDNRGNFFECYNARDFADLGLPTQFVQDNISQSRHGVLRGLHFQWDKPMGKLLQVVWGTIQLVEVDIRPGSPHLGKHMSLYIDHSDPKLIWIPPGFANGFLVLSDYAVVHYKCSTFYNPNGEGAIRWNDPSLQIEWRTAVEPIISTRDTEALTLKQWLTQPQAQVFAYNSHNT